MSAPATMKAKALEHAERGRRVFPLVPQGKKPRIPNVHPEGDPLHGICRGECGQQGHGLYDATDDPAVISDWWDRYPTANVGIAIEDDEVLVDADPKHGGSLQQVIDAYELPPTECVQTGSGGHHAIYTLPWGSDPSRIRNKLGTGIDIKTVGGYRVAPGSVHETGNLDVAVNDTPPAQANEKLLQALVKPEPKTPAGQPITAATAAAGENPKWVNAGVEAVLEELRTTPEGGAGTRFKGRDDAVWQTACRLAEFVLSRDISEDWALQALLEAGRETGFDDALIEEKFDRALNRVDPAVVPAKGGVNHGDTTLVDRNGVPIVDKLEEVDADGQPTEAAKEAQDSWANAVRQKAMEMRLTDEAKQLHAAWKVQQAGLTPCPGVDLEEFLAVPDEDAQYRITGLLPTGGRALLAAQQKAGKTSLLGALIKSLADGTPFLGRFHVQQVERVTLFDTELDERMLRRWLRRNGVKNRSRVKVHTLRGKLSTFDFRDETLRRFWLDELRGSDFVILDCLRPVLDTFGLSEDKDAGKFLVAWDEFLADAGVGESVVAHHMGHTGERARGDSRLQDWPDVNWRIVKESQTVKDDDQSVGMDGGRRFFSAHGRDVDVAEMALDFDNGELTLTEGTRRTAKVDDAIAPLIEILGRNDIGDGLTQNALSQRLQAQGIPQHIARKAIAKAVKDAIALRKDGPNRSQLHILNPSWMES